VSLRLVKGGDGGESGTGSGGGEPPDELNANETMLLKVSRMVAEDPGLFMTVVLVDDEGHITTFSGGLGDPLKIIGALHTAIGMVCDAAKDEDEDVDEDGDDAS
jgi:hypothetical protein